MPTFDTALQNEAITAFADLLSNGNVRILEGATILVEINIPNDAFGTAADGAIDLASNISATNTASGTADSFEARSSSGNVLTGTVGGPGSGAEMIIESSGDGDDLELVENGTTTITSFEQSFTA